MPATPPAPATVEQPTPPPPAPSLPPTFSSAKAAADAPQFSLVARQVGDDDQTPLTLLQTDGHAFAVAGPALLELAADGSLAYDPATMVGLGGAVLDAVEAGMIWWAGLALAGSWPDDVFFVLEERSGSRAGVSAPELYRRRGGPWTKIDTRRGKISWYPREFGRWKDGSLLALKGFYEHYSTEGEGDVEPPEREVKAIKAAIAREKKLIVLRGEPKAPAFGSRAIRTFASLPTGQIFAALEEGEPAVLHFDGAAERVLPLPDAKRESVAVAGLRAAAPDRAWAFGGDDDGGYLARFDGGAWTEVENPCAGQVVSLSLDAAGDAYFVCPVGGGGAARQVLLRARGDAIEELPTAAEPQEVLARGANDIWFVTTAGRQGAELWHTGTTRGEPFVVPGAYAAAQAIAEWEPALPAGDDCSYMWIPLVAGSDREAIAAAIAGADDGDFMVELRDARVQGRVETGVLVREFDVRKSKGTLRRAQALLGAAAGTPSCNERPAAEPG